MTGLGVGVPSFVTALTIALAVANAVRAESGTGILEQLAMIKLPMMTALAIKRVTDRVCLR
jgi:hypothetical protein